MTETSYDRVIASNGCQGHAQSNISYATPFDIFHGFVHILDNPALIECFQSSQGPSQTQAHKVQTHKHSSFQNNDILFDQCLCTQTLNMNIDFVAASDLKKHSRKFLDANHSYQHIFCSAFDHVGGKGVCEVHSTAARQAVCSIPHHKADLVVAGLPCPPFSRLRSRTGGSASLSTPQEHPEYTVVFEEFEAMVASYSPGAFLVEETEGFLEKNQDGTRFIDQFINIYSTKGYHCRALRLHADTWIQWPRVRF